MRTLRYGDTGPLVQLLQTALRRAGFDSLNTDGIFGVKTRAAVTEFQMCRGLSADGIAGGATHRALMPFYLGYTVHTVRQGDTLYKIAMEHGSTLRAVETANPSLNPMNLRIGSTVIVPLPFRVVPENIAFGSTALKYSVLGLAARYPFLRVGEIGKSVMGKPIYSITAGNGGNRVLYNGAHHANEWITVPLILKFTEELADAKAAGKNIYGIPAEKIFKVSTLSIVPAVNPDGIDH